MRRRLSLRFRITAGALVVVVAALSLSGVLVTEVVEHAMTDQIDRTLRADADFAERSFTTGTPISPSEGPNGLYVQFLDRSTGAVSGMSPQVRHRPALMKEAQANGTIATVHDARLGTVRSLVVAAPGNAHVSLILARSSHDVAAVGSTLTRLLVALIVFGSALLGVVIFWVVGRALHPVEQMRRTVEKVGDDRLATRLALPGTRDELDRLATTLNDLLQRLEAAMAAERRFVADASHDLRTPIAALRVNLEAEADDPELTVLTRAEALARVEELQDLVDRLLVLSTADRGADPPEEPVDLDDLVLTQARRIRAKGDLVVDTTRVSGGQVTGSDTDLARVVANLTANAVRYAHRAISFTVHTFGDTVELVVDDDGPGIPAADRDRIFERFATLDDARTNGRSGTGLGLAIAAAIVATHRGTIWAEEAPGGGARLSVRLPAHVPPSPAPTPSTDRRVGA